MPDKVPWTCYAGLMPHGEAAERLKQEGLGLVVVRVPFKQRHPNVRVETQEIVVDGERRQITTWHTPVGDLTQVARTEPGYGTWWTFEHMIKDVRDYEIMEFVVRDTVYEPDYEGFLETRKAFGDTGIVLGSVCKQPIQQLWTKLAGAERMSLDLYDHPDVVDRFVKAMQEKDREMWHIVADSPAEFIWLPDNITGEITGPPLFRKYCMPYYEEVAAVLHPKGRILVCHMDGMMRSLVDCVAETPLDVIEAFTPPPDGNLPLAEARAAWKDKVIWINFPSSIHLASPADVKRRTIEMLRDCAPGDRFAVSVTENVPADVIVRSFTVITETINESGVCPY